MRPTWRRRPSAARRTRPGWNSLATATREKPVDGLHARQQRAAPRPGQPTRSSRRSRSAWRRTWSRAAGDRLYVSNWGGDPPAEGDPQAKSSGTPVHIDPTTGVADHGSVSVLAAEDGKWKQIKTIAVGLQAVRHGRQSRRAASSTSPTPTATPSPSSTRKTDKVVETILCRPEVRLPFGSGCNAVAVSPDGGTLYVANGTNNCIAVVRLAAGVVRRRIRRPARCQHSRRPDPDRLVSRRRAALRRRQDAVRRQRQGPRFAEPAAGRREGQELPRPSRLRFDHRRAGRRPAGGVHEAGQRQQPPRLQPGRPRQTAARREAGPDAAAARRAVGVQARDLHHQGEPHLRSGARRHEGGRRRPEIVPIRRGRDAEPPRPGPAVHAVRQLLLQRRPQRRRPLLDRPGLLRRLPRKVVRRLHAQLSRRRQRPAGLRLARLSLGQRPVAQEDVPQLRRIRVEHIRSEKGAMARPVRRLQERDDQREGDGEGEPQDAGSRTRTPAIRGSRC